MVQADLQPKELGTDKSACLSDSVVLFAVQSMPYKLIIKNELKT